ncbi:MAG: IS3 family transposase [Nitrospira sp.]|nr:IS3 family transposase [Nitrospira sp.]
MIDRTHQLPIGRQCQLLQLARSTAYYQSRPVSETTLMLMRRIDELHLQYPFAGARMLRDVLRRERYRVGRRQVATMMRRMGITAVYRTPRTSRRYLAHRIYLYLLHPEPPIAKRRMLLNPIPQPLQPGRRDLGGAVLRSPGANPPGSRRTPGDCVVPRHPTRRPSRVGCRPVQRVGFQRLP